MALATGIRIVSRPGCPAPPRGLLLALAMLLVIAQMCPAQTRLEVRRGWGNKERAGRWNPVFARASSGAPQDVMLDAVFPVEGGFAATMREHVATGPTAAWFELFAPTHYSTGLQSVLVVRDAETGRTIAQSPERLVNSSKSLSELGPGGILMGISGRPSPVETVALGGVADTGYLPSRFLPRATIGYDAIDVLCLNRPKLDEIDAEQERAILDWVRAGGSLLFVPSEDPIPAADLLAPALPAGVGDVAMVNLSPDTLKAAGMPPRFARLAGRALSPRPAAVALPLLGGPGPAAYAGRYGLGRMMVAPIDLLSIEFDPELVREKGPAFWRPIVRQLVGGTPPAPKRKYNAPYYGYESESEDQEREGAAAGTVCDFVAAGAPGGGRRFDVPLAVLAILFAIGPIDSLVLLALHRRPWTWTTAPAWLALVACGGGLVVGRLRTADVDCRAVRLIEQADDQTIATTELVGLASSAGGRYAIETPGTLPGAWWQPAIPGLAAGQAVPPQPNVQFHASDGGTTPEPFFTEPGVPRFFRADHIAAGGPVVRAALAVRGSDAAPRLSGTIKNVSDRPLKDVRVRTRFGVVTPPLGPGGALPPGQTLAIDVPAKGEAFTAQKVEAQYQSYGYFGSRHLATRVRESDLWAVVPDLAGRRTLHVDQMISGREDVGCVYAQTVNPSPAIEIEGPGRKVAQAFQWIRATVALQR